MPADVHRLAVRLELRTIAAIIAFVADHPAKMARELRWTLDQAVLAAEILIDDFALRIRDAAFVELRQRFEHRARIQELRAHAAMQRPRKENKETMDPFTEKQRSRLAFLAASVVACPGAYEALIGTVLHRDTPQPLLGIATALRDAIWAEKLARGGVDREVLRDVAKGLVQGKDAYAREAGSELARATEVAGP